MIFPAWVEDRRFVVYLDSRPVAALYVKERALNYCERYNERRSRTRPAPGVEEVSSYWVLDRGA